ncbi:2285_t:CDS:2, partial [Funneliformis mosseae]
MEVKTLPEFMVHLKLLSRIALRQESDRLDAGDNYAIGDTESEDD